MRKKKQKNEKKKKNTKEKENKKRKWEMYIKKQPEEPEKCMKTTKQTASQIDVFVYIVLVSGDNHRLRSASIRNGAYNHQNKLEVICAKIVFQNGFNLYICN